MEEKITKICEKYKF